jgi:hypothetical protein
MTNNPIKKGMTLNEAGEALDKEARQARYTNNRIELLNQYIGDLEASAIKDHLSKEIKIAELAEEADLIENEYLVILEGPFNDYGDDIYLNVADNPNSPEDIAHAIRVITADGDHPTKPQ